MGLQCSRFRSASHHDLAASVLLTRTLFWIGLAVAVVAAAWLVLSLVPMPSNVHYEAANPWEIGNSEDAFDYAGEDAQLIEGTARLRFDLSTPRG
jgi:hypothetical protein